MTWRSDCVLLRLPALRTRFPPREWDLVRRVRVAIGVHVVHLDVVIADAPTCHGGQRRWLKCPNADAGCGRLTSVVGLDVTTGVVGCRVCMAWRTRPVAGIAPHARDPLAPHESVVSSEVT